MPGYTLITILEKYLVYESDDGSHELWIKKEVRGRK